MSELNDRKWYKQMVTLNIDRTSLLYLVGIIELALRHPDLPDSSRKEGVKTGKIFASCLLDDGLILPDEVGRAWEKTFNIPYIVDPDRIIPELTDGEGDLWK